MWLANGNRSHQRYLHGFLFFVDWYKTVLIEKQTSIEAAEAATTIVRKWEELHPKVFAAQSMAYHDETTAQRLINLISLHQSIQSLVPESESAWIRSLMSSTADLLASDDFHAVGNNHGMFQDLALLYWSIASADQSDPRRAEFFEKAMIRLKDYFSTCFTSEGVHVENTPTYHLMVSRHVSNVQRIAASAGHPDASYYEDLISNAELYATHALMPNGVFPPISDTQQVEVAKSGMQKIFTSPEFAYASSGGSHGRKPELRSLVLPKSGYAIYRSRWGDPAATYAFFSAAYNADYHKHSDDLSFFLRSSGIDLLSESGPFSYDYKNPLSKYAYSQFAHNSLVVDGRSLPRTDDRSDKVTLRSVDERDDGFTVLGTNERYEEVIHERVVAVTEKSRIPRFDIMDTITADGEHEYQLLWNLGTEVSATMHGQGFELFHEGRKVMDMMISADVPTSLSLYEGVEKPRPLGWRFPKFGEAVPAKVVVVNFRGSNVKLETRIRLADYNYLETAPSVPEAGTWKRRGEVPLNYVFNPGRTPDGRKRMAVVFSGVTEPGNFTYDYRSVMDDVDINTLYILDDFGTQGAYYYSDHRSNAIYRSVQALIGVIAEKKGISPSGIATVGFSRGGTAALIHGFALSAGMIVAGAPHTRIGTATARSHPDTLRFMAGGTDAGDIEYLDHLVEDFGKGSGASRVAILVDETDPTALRNVQRLVAAIAEGGGPTAATAVVPNLSDEDPGSIFPLYLAASLEHWIAESVEEALPYRLVANASERSVTVETFAPSDAEISYRLYKGREIVRRLGYSEKRMAIFRDLPAGTYRIRVYTSYGSSQRTSTFTTRRVTV